MALKFNSGDKVLYIPNHANGDPEHEDCERGIVSCSSPLGNVFVNFDDQPNNSSSKGCYPENLQLI